MQTIIEEGFFDEKNIPVQNKEALDSKLIDKFLLLDQKINSLGSIDWYNYYWASKLVYIPHNIEVYEYLSWTTCNICSHKNTTKTVKFNYDNKIFIFPSNYIHYVRYHNVIPSKNFIDMLDKLKENEIILPIVDKKIAEQAVLLTLMDGSQIIKYFK